MLFLGVTSEIFTVFADKSLFINCGGKEGEFEGNDYVGDLELDGISNFDLRNEGQWAYSSTGVYLGNADAGFIAQNTFSLNITGPDYYQNARLSPLSLNYYGLCLPKGNYKVKLHFAEIMFSNDQTFSSLGRRIFDVSIQVSVDAKYFVTLFWSILTFLSYFISGIRVKQKFRIKDRNSQCCIFAGY